MFIKRGDGKIVSVLNEEEMTEEQKKAAADLAKQNKKDNSLSKNSKNEE